MVSETERRTMTYAQADAAEIDAGLRNYMLRVYNYMASGLLLSGIVAYVIANTTLSNLFFQVVEGRLGYTGLGFVAMLAPLGLIFFMSFTWQKRSATSLQFMYWLFVGLMGIGLSISLIAYTGASVTRVFFITAASFSGLSLVGYTTKKNLSGMGTFLLMGLIGLIVASIVNVFLASSMMHFLISVIGVLIFAGLTVYDTQRIKNTYFAVSGSGVEEHTAVMGAVALYLNFINLFHFLMMLFGSRE